MNLDELEAAVKKRRVMQKLRGIEEHYVIDERRGYAILKSCTGNIPSRVEIPHFVGRIENKCFMSKDIIKDLVLNEGLIVIGSEAFRGTSITSVNLPSSLEQIYSGAFSYSALEEILVPEGVTSLGDGIFYGCENLISAKFNCNIASSASICANCINLKSVVITKSSKISESAFSNCEKLEKIDLKRTGVSVIGENAFSYCSSLKDIQFDNKLFLIEDTAFYNCSSLTELRLPRNLLEIGENSFAGCHLAKISCKRDLYKRLCRTTFKDFLNAEYILS